MADSLPGARAAWQHDRVPTHVALLRGINVGGRNKVAMADLRDVVTAAGHTDVATYIQSGNVVFTTKQTDTAALAAALEQRIKERLAVPAGVVVLSRTELARVVADNPYPDEDNPKFLHAIFRTEKFGPKDRTALAAAEKKAHDKGSHDEACVVGRTLFLHTPGGLGRSELAAQLSRSSTGGTARNWATVAKLLAMLDA
ncbi:MAG: DUF1697 domain-containing protein [Acidimicrobiales bacterium]